MFTELLSPIEKNVLIEVLAAIAQADGVIHPAEQDIVIRYGLSLGLSSADIDTQLLRPITLGDIQFAEISDEARRVIFIEANTLALIDGEVNSEEAKMTAALGARLGLSLNVQEAIIRHVRKGFDWTMEGMALIQSDGNQ